MPAHHFEPTVNQPAAPRAISRILSACLAALPVAGFAGGCTEPATAVVTAARVAVGGESLLVPHFVAAARRTGVPAELLATVAYVETRLAAPAPVAEGDHVHQAPRHGVMALGPLHEAAALAGFAPAVAATDARANIESAAAWLAARAPVDSAMLSDWAPALAEYGGDRLPDEVFTRLELGWHGVDDAGRSVVVSARDVGGVSSGIGHQTLALGYPGAIWNAANSGNYQASSRDAADIDFVVIHTTQGSYSGAISWFQNASSNVSSHYVVRSSDGQITQMVDDTDIAWHDGCFNTNSIGIEHEGFVADPARWYTENMYMASAALTAWLAEQHTVPVDRTHILGHVETPDCSDHTDPGTGWNWSHYMDLVRAGGMAVFDAGARDAATPQSMTSGEEAVVWFEFENQGNSTWGLDETRLGTQDPQDRESAFFVDGNWLSPSRATGADHSDYGPGAVGRFSFVIRAPEVDAETSFTETFQLLQEGVAWFGPKVTIVVRVTPSVPPANPLDPEAPAVELPGGSDMGDYGGGCAVAGAAPGSGLGGFALLVGCAILLRGVRRRSRARS